MPDICYNCGEAMKEGERRGTFMGTEMHQLCAIELRLDALEDALSDDDETVSVFDAVTAVRLH